MIRVIIAYADKKKIQARYNIEGDDKKKIQARYNIEGDDWEDVPVPNWNFNIFEYRIKQEEKSEPAYKPYTKEDLLLIILT